MVSSIAIRAILLSAMPDTRNMAKNSSEFCTGGAPVAALFPDDNSDISQTASGIANR